MGAVKKPTNPSKSNEQKLAFFREVMGELKKVHWPSRQQLLTYTAIVLVSVGILAVVIWIVDSALTFVLNQLLS